jgi:hypothetical protein
VRVYYLLTNRKAVVAVLDPDTVVEPDLLAYVRLTTSANLVAPCEQLLASDVRRSQLEELGYEPFAKRDVTKIIKRALD